MTDQEILSLQNAYMDETAPDGFSVCLYCVASACFNDERLLHSRNLPLQELKDKPLVFFDPFFGKSHRQSLSVALAAYVDRKLYLIVDRDGQRSVTCDNVFTADGDPGENFFYAAHFYRFMSND